VARVPPLVTGPTARPGSKVVVTMIETSKSQATTSAPRTQVAAISPVSGTEVATPSLAGSEASAAQAVAERIRRYLRESGRELDFHVDADTNRVVVTVRDRQTGEIIRQIPSEEILRIARSLPSPIEHLVDLLA
jgi:flagellar protein FlaG